MNTFRYTVGLALVSLIVLLLPFALEAQSNPALILPSGAVIEAQSFPAPTPVAAPAPAPAAPSANDGVHLDMSTAFYQLSDGKSATVMTGRLPITNSFSLTFSEYLIPDAKGNIGLGGGEYRRTLASLLGKSAAQSAKVNLSKIEAYARLGMGSEISAVDNKHRFALGIEGGLAFPVANVAGNGVVTAGVAMGYLYIPYANGKSEKFSLGSVAQVSPQLAIRF